MEGFVKYFEEKFLLETAIELCNKGWAIEEISKALKIPRDDVERTLELIKLCNKGWTIEEIAKTLNISRDEVERILELRKLEKPNTNDSLVRSNWIIEEISIFLNISNDETILLLEQEYVEKKSNIIDSLGKKIRQLKGLHEN